MKSILFTLLAITLAGIGCSPRLSPDSDWGNERWVLTELKEVPVQLSGTRRDAFFEFSPRDKRFSGNAGCNRVSGNYELKGKNKISFGEVTTTKMSCEDIAFETTFLATLNKVDRFERRENTLLFKDGNEIVLKYEPRGRRTGTQDRNP